MCICFGFIITTIATIITIDYFLQFEVFGFDYCASTQLSASFHQ